MRGECFPPPVASHNLEFNPRARNKLVLIPVEYRCVQEYVFTIVVRPDKSVTTHMIELKYPACNQLRPPSLQNPVPPGLRSALLRSTGVVRQLNMRGGLSCCL
jgi:hypothetical protein